MVCETMVNENNTRTEKLCGFCGTQLEEEEDYCSYCGTDYTGDE